MHPYIKSINWHPETPERARERELRDIEQQIAEYENRLIGLRKRLAELNIERVR
jgi:hypothetical protein